MMRKLFIFGPFESNYPPPLDYQGKLSILCPKSNIDQGGGGGGGGDNGIAISLTILPKQKELLELKF